MRYRYPTLRSVVGFASSLTPGGVTNSRAPSGLWTLTISGSRIGVGFISFVSSRLSSYTCSWLSAWRRIYQFRLFETYSLDITKPLTLL